MSPETPDVLENITPELGAPADDIMSVAAESSTTLKQFSSSVFSHMFERQLFDTQSEMDDAMDKAEARFRTEKEMPPAPFKTQSRKWLLSCYQAGRQQIMKLEKDSRISHRQAIVGIEAHVSKTTLEHLDRGTSSISPLTETDGFTLPCSLPLLVSFRKMHIRKTHTVSNSV